MKDLIIGIASLVIGTSGLIALKCIRRKLPEWEARRAQLKRLTKVELHSEITRCAGAIFVCANKGDRKGMMHAWRAMRPIMRELAKR
jgi:hypothetical protein